MLNEYINKLFKSHESLDQVIRIKRNELKTLEKKLNILNLSTCGALVTKVNLSIATNSVINDLKYDFANIQSLCKYTNKSF